MFCPISERILQDIITKMGKATPTGYLVCSALNVIKAMFEILDIMNLTECLSSFGSH